MAIQNIVGHRLLATVDILRGCCSDMRYTGTRAHAICPAVTAAVPAVDRRRGRCAFLLAAVVAAVGAPVLVVRLGAREALLFPRLLLVGAPALRDRLPGAVVGCDPAKEAVGDAPRHPVGLDALALA